MAQRMADEDLDQIDGFLGRVKGGAIPNAEALDGFFAALACCPDLIMPSEYMPVIQSGADEDGDLVFDGLEEAQRFMALTSRHWNAVNDQLNSGDVYLPVMMEGDDGVTRGNDWANGFLEGTKLRREIWADLLEDEEEGGALIPIFALAYENHPDPEMRTYDEPITQERREDLIIAAAGVMRMHALFISAREPFLSETETFARAAPKPGRNAPCPCGSGKKYKKCCGAGPTLH